MSNLQRTSGSLLLNVCLIAVLCLSLKAPAVRHVVVAVGAVGICGVCMGAVVATGANYQIKGAYSIPCTGIDQAVGTTGAGTGLTLTTGNLATAKEIAIGALREASGTGGIPLAIFNPPTSWPTLIDSFINSAYASMTTTITTTPLTYNPSWSPTSPFNQAVLATFPLSSTINTGSMNLTMKYQAYPGDTQSSLGPFTITPSLEFQTFHLRSRQVAMHLDWATATGFTARVEAIRFRVSPSGKRP